MTEPRPQYEVTIERRHCYKELCRDLAQLASSIHPQAITLQRHTLELVRIAAVIQEQGELVLPEDEAENERLADNH